MKTDWTELDQYRVLVGPYKSPLGAHYGMFAITKGGWDTLEEGSALITMIATDGLEAESLDMEPWEHVSVSIAVAKDGKQYSRMPGWREMCQVKDIFWGLDEAVMQVHPPEQDYVNNHPTCLHLWKPVKLKLPLPPKECV